MREGRLVWTRARNGAWHTGSLVDESHMYVTSPQDGGWGVELRRRHAETTDLGWHPYLRQAKLAADEDHHQRILADDESDQSLKDYIERYPL